MLKAHHVAWWLGKHSLALVGHYHTLLAIVQLNIYCLRKCMKWLPIWQDIEFYKYSQYEQLRKLSKIPIFLHL